MYQILDVSCIPCFVSLSSNITNKSTNKKIQIQYFKYWTSPAFLALYLSQYHDINCINTQAQILQIQMQIQKYKYTISNTVLAVLSPKLCYSTKKMIKTQAQILQIQIHNTQ